MPHTISAAFAAVPAWAQLTVIIGAVSGVLFAADNRIDKIEATVTTMETLPAKVDSISAQLHIVDDKVDGVIITTGLLLCFNEAGRGERSYESCGRRVLN